MRIALRIFVAIIIVISFAGFVFERIGRRRDRHRYPQVGRSINIGGRSLNIDCSGTGGPTVVFDTFSHMAGFAWSHIQPDIAQFTHACWYDRAGYGWSQPGGALPTFRSEAASLHTLLAAAGETPPYVFVGPGDAALRLRVYRSLYPREVSGMVLINPIGVDENRVDIPEEAKGFWAKRFGVYAPQVRGTACKIVPALSEFGVLRFASSLSGPRRTPSLEFPPGEQKELDFLSDPASGTNAEVCSRDENMDEARHVGDLGELPLIVLASHPASERSAREKIRLNQVLPGVAGLSTRGRLILTDGNVSGTDITTAVHEVVRRLTGKPD